MYTFIAPLLQNSLVGYRLQISYHILREFKQINQLLFPQKSSENLKSFDRSSGGNRN